MAARSADFDCRHGVRLGALSNRFHRGIHIPAFHVQPDAIRRVHGPKQSTMIETIQWTEAGVVMIDQTKLPREETYVTCTDYKQVADAIRTMVIRGAPAIGVAAAMGVALGMQQATSDEEFDEICRTLAATRPTAVNLFWAIGRMRRVYGEMRERSIEDIRARLIAEARQMHLEDIAINECI